MHLPPFGSRACFFVVLCLLLLAPLFGQSDTAQISGFVRDPAGLGIPGASLTITNEATQVERKTVTNDQGYYVVTNVPSGYYTLTVEMDGFKKFVTTRNKLDANINAGIDAKMDIGEVNEVVSVVASASQIQSDTATVAKLIEQKQIEKMMLNGRNPLYLATLKPGVRGTLASFGYGLTTAGLSINGGRSQDFLITFDGAVGVRTRANGTSIGTADVDTVSEVQILTANYNAEYGRSAGGQIRFISKSGGRDFHGSLYEYFRNDKLDANSWSRNRATLPAGQTKAVREANKFNQFGYNINGPVMIPGLFNTERNKLFFVWSQEWTKRRRESTTIVTVPTMKMRNGDFSELLTTNPYFSGTTVVKDPLTGQAFPNNVIPTTRLSPNGLGFLRAFPEPTPNFISGRANFMQTRPQPEDQRKDNLALDWILSEKQSVRFRGSMYKYESVDAFRTGFDRAITDWNRPNRTGSISHLWSLSPTMINEIMATASVDVVFIGIYREGERFARSKYGINYPYLFPDRKEIPDKIPTITISNFQELDGGPYPSSSAGPIYSLSDNFTKIWGTHSLKFGALYEKAGQNDFDQINVSGVPNGTNNQNGRFVFDNTRAGAETTGLGVANAAMGLFTSYAEIGPRANTPYRSNMFEWYAQDSWKATPQLTLEYGVRWTYVTPYYYSNWGNIAIFDAKKYDPSKAVVQDPKTGYVLSGDRYNGVVIPGNDWPEAAKGRVAIADSGEYDRLFSGGSNLPAKRQWGNFQPRLGFAYTFGEQKNVIRGGAGKFMARPGVSDNVFLGGNPPFQPMMSLATGQADNPAGGKPSYFPQFFMTMDPEFNVPHSYMWNIFYERRLPMETTVSVGYVGRTGNNLERERNINTLPVGTLYLPENKGINTNVLRPYKGFANIPMAENAAHSEYDALQIEMNRRFDKGLGFGVAYTYSRTYDNAHERRYRMLNPLDASLDWGPSNLDTPHILVVNFIYEVPFMRQASGLPKALLGGWTVTGVAQFGSGGPFHIGTGDDFAGIGSGNETQLWVLAEDLMLPEGERKYSQGVSDTNFYFRTKTASGAAIATVPANGTFSTEHRNSAGRHPGAQSWNMAVFKAFSITESQRVEFRSEFFNLPNHPNWGGVDTNPRSPLFGRVTTKGGDPRNIQLSLRYQF
ncbi:MAG: TonB-dependent receptor [Acidobacteria bacterium]|nr:MAG: TonB-dependent receptor [Acidobacteriota bacterium]